MELYLNDLPVPDDAKSYTIYPLPEFLQIIMDFYNLLVTDVLDNPIPVGHTIDSITVDSSNPFEVSETTTYKHITPKICFDCCSSYADAETNLLTGRLYLP